jgi:site-specific DNA-methyltransferase (adenine-specific)
MEEVINSETMKPGIGTASPITPYYQDSAVTIYHGDCREILPTITADLLLSDPQYQLADGKRANTMGLSTGRGTDVLKGIKLRQKDWGTFKGDEVPFDPTELLRFPKVILWGAIHYANRLPNSTSWLIWDKRNGTDSDDNADAEMARSNIGGPARVHRQLWRGICRAGEENIALQGEKLHPFQKPIALMRWCLSLVPKAQRVVDHQMGSGTTLRAAKDLGRKAIGIEIEEKYCEIAAKRMAQEVLNLAA